MTPRKIVANVLMAGVGVVIFVGIQTAFGRQDKLCEVIYTFVAQADAQIGKPGSASYELLQKLPPKQRRAVIHKSHEDSQRLLDGLSYCEPDDISELPRAKERRKRAAGSTSLRARSGDATKAAKRVPATPSDSRPANTRPPASTNPPDTTPDRSPPPARTPSTGTTSPSGPGGPAPGEPRPPDRTREPPTIFERLCAELPTVERPQLQRVC